MGFESYLVLRKVRSPKSPLSPSSPKSPLSQRARSPLSPKSPKSRVSNRKARDMDCTSSGREAIRDTLRQHGVVIESRLGMGCNGTPFREPKKSSVQNTSWFSGAPSLQYSLNF